MEKNKLAGLVHGTDPNFSLATHTGHSKANAKHSDPQPTMKLTAEEQEIYDGKKGQLLQNAIKTIIDYGQMFGAEKLVDLGGDEFLKEVKTGQTITVHENGTVEIQ